MNQATEKTVISVGYRYEADSASAALSDAGIANYIRQTPSDNFLVLPSALGFTENGFDVVVRIEDAAKAEELLASLGMSGDEVVTPVEDAADTEAAEQSEDTVLTEQSTSAEAVAESDAAAAEEEPEATLLQKIGVAIIALIAVALVVWLTDTVIYWVQSLLGCGRYAG